MNDSSGTTAADPEGLTPLQDVTAVPRVLVVDDDPAIRRMLDQTLREEGLLVDCAEHGVAALARVHEHPPDLIILDLMMPVMDGWETVDRLREEGYDDIPVIVLTAAPMLPRIRAQFPESPVIGKPFDLSQLISAVQRTLGSPR
jgi:CheY-like chemotaxis protein